MLVIYRFYFCIEYQQGPGGGTGCHCEAMKFEFHSKMHLILSNSVANLLPIVSQVSNLYLTCYNSQFISIKIIKNIEPHSSSTVHTRSTCVKDALRLRKTLQQRRKLISFQREYLRNEVNAQTFTELLNGQTCL